MRVWPTTLNAWAIRTILEDHKTQARWPLRPQPSWPQDGPIQWSNPARTHDARYLCEDGSIAEWRCPFGVPGDKFRVLERGSISVSGDAFMYEDYGVVLAPDADPYSANWAREWKPCRSARMPHWASRINIEVTGVRVQRVREISDADVLAEGVSLPDCSAGHHRRYQVWLGRECVENDSAQYVYGQLWNSINARRGFGWDTNCWVWVPTFRRVPAARRARL